VTKEQPGKAFPTVGCCGLDCGLCPRYYTVGSSRCPGCAGPEFFEKHPSCGYITCCVKKRGLEVCSQCEEFPCSRFEPWLANCGEHDSFVTHRQVSANLDFIRTHGVDNFMKQQNRRIGMLETMLQHFDDGRSRSFYCIAATLLPIEDLEASLAKARKEVVASKIKPDDIKSKAKILRGFLNVCAAGGRIELKLRKRAKANGD
jgi:hypothetical protein